MSGKTTFAGFEWLAPGEAQSADGYYFQARNPFIADRLGRLGAVTHKHDAHAAMGNPATAPTVTTPSTGGAIAAAQAIYVTYTLNDADGGETLPVTPLLVTTAAGFGTPNAAPTAAVDYTAGSLLANTYAYALTVSDGVGGETIIGPAALVTVDPGHATARVNLSGLDTILAAVSGGAGGATWRLWRMQGGSPWYLIGTGTGATFVDGGVAGDCTVTPPTQSTTQGTNGLVVTVPSAGQPAGAVTFNIYADLDGSFTGPCRLVTLPVASYDVAQTFSHLVALPGAPPAVSTCFPGANKIDPDTDILNWSWKRTVANYAALAALTGMGDGDVRVTLDTHLVWIYDLPNTAWKRSPWLPPVANAGALPATNLLDGDVCMTLDTRELWTFVLATPGWKRLRPKAILGRFSDNPTWPNVALGSASKVALATVDTDTETWWDGTNTRYTPQRAGWYKARGVVQILATTTVPAELAVAKNGATLLDGITRVPAFAGPTMEVNVDVHMNGTTDYLELFGGVAQAAVNTNHAGLVVSYLGD